MRVKDSVAGEPWPAVSAWDGIRWPVYSWRLLGADDPALAALAPDESLDRLRQAVAAVGGVFALREPATAEKPTKGWDLADEDAVKRFSVDAQHVDAHRPEAVEAFVATWGLLGVGLFSDSRHDVDQLLPLLESPLRLTDSFLATAETLAQWQDRLRSMKRLRRHDEVGWREFAASVQLPLSLAMLHPTIGWNRSIQRPVRRWIVDNPAQVLWIRLWDMATGDGPLRWCRERACGALFSAARIDQVYCDHHCASRASAAAHYKRIKAARRKTRGTR